MSSTAESLWIDVGMWSSPTGRIQPFTEVQVDPPEEAPGTARDWQDWALGHLSTVAEQDKWQPGRYHFTVERRDPSGRSLDSFAHAIWEWQT